MYKGNKIMIAAKEAKSMTELEKAGCRVYNLGYYNNSAITIV